MAKRNPPPAPATPEVRFERSDIEARGVALFGVALGTGVLFVLIAMLWYGQVLFHQHRKTDPLKLPRASVDTHRLPPEPRLEGSEDVREGNPRMRPARAREYLEPQESLLDEGDPAKKILPIKQAMAAMLRSQPVRKTGDKTAPTMFTIRLPSKAASGRRMTGGQ